MEMHYAHTKEGYGESEWQTLKDHSLGVAKRASEFAEPFGCASWAFAAGLLHDMGKGCVEFQQRLHKKHPTFDHAAAGAFFASNTAALNETMLIKEGHAIAPVVAGHHGGLQDYRGASSLNQRLEAYKRKEIPQVSEASEDVAALQGDSSVGERLMQLCLMRGERQKEFLSFSVFTLEHLLFSSLVDADWLDTEKFMSPEVYGRRQSARKAQDELDVLSDRLDAYLESLEAEGPVNQARAEYLRQARASASLPPGLFELSMPTGSGKTLTSLSFALRHALANGQTRVIYAIPFMSIVEQNAQVLRDTLGAENVIEHVSSYDYGLASTSGQTNDAWDLESAQDPESRERSLRERMLVPDWDAPIVVSTNVQLFESLFTNKVSRARKVHNIANSVIVLDEAQSLPDGLLIPTLAMLESLVAVAHVSVVLCTATQPALEELWPFQAKPIPLVMSGGATSDVFGGRVQFDCSHALQGNAYMLDELVDEIVKEDSVLCVVSSRRAAGVLFDMVSSRLADDEGLFHLSALMTPEHRSQEIESIRRRLKEGRPCRVVSTQLIEAGVDVDFPVVYREVAGTDSVLQAAGRCNREGRLPNPGHVVVFDCNEFDAFRSARPNWLGKMRALGLETLRWAAEQGVDPFGDESIRRFFNRRHQTGSLDGSSKEPIFGLITDPDIQVLQDHIAYCRYPHETIAGRYRFFREEDVSLFVPWGKGGEELLQVIEQGDFGYELFPRLQRFSVSVPKFVFEAYERIGAIRHIGRFPVPILETRDGFRTLYDNKKGLLSPGEEEVELLVI